MKTESLSLGLIRLDGGTQSRLTINHDTVEDYAEVLRSVPPTEWPFPPLDVFHDGTDYFMSNGFHRYLGAQDAGRASAPCVVHKVTANDALLFGMTSNDKNGIRRSPADKRANVEWILDNLGKLPQKEIAEKAGVGLRLVSAIIADRKPKLVPQQSPPSATKAHGARLQPKEVVPPAPNGKPKPDPKPITALTGRAHDVFEAKQVMKTWADAVGRWMSGRPAGIDEYREKFPGLAGDKVINAAKAFWEALEAWNRGLK